jgi:hypothetical protein
MGFGKERGRERERKRGVPLFPFLERSIYSIKKSDEPEKNQMKSMFRINHIQNICLLFALENSLI